MLAFIIHSNYFVVGYGNKRNITAQNCEND